MLHHHPVDVDRFVWARPFVGSWARADNRTAAWIERLAGDRLERKLARHAEFDCLE